MTRTTSTSTTSTTSNKDKAMKTKGPQMTIDMVKQLKGEELLAAYEQVLGTAAKPKTPVPVLRSRIVTELEKRAAQAAAKPAKVAKPRKPKAAASTTDKDAAQPAPTLDNLAALSARAAETPVEAAAPVAEPKTSTERALPPIGTKIVKRDRKGNIRAACEVVEGGVLYAGKTYQSLSGAALQAAHDLGLKTKTLNGWAWWGLADEPRPARAPKAKHLDLSPIDKGWARFWKHAQTALAEVSDDQYPMLLANLSDKAYTLTQLMAKVHERAPKAQAETPVADATPDVA